MARTLCAFILLSALAVVTAGQTGCGKKGPPVPPAEYRMTQPEDSDGSQKLKDLEIREESGRRLFELYSKDKNKKETSKEDDSDKESDDSKTSEDSSNKENLSR